MRHDRPFYADCYGLVVINDRVSIKMLKYEELSGYRQPRLWDGNVVKSSWAAIAKTRFVGLALVALAVRTGQSQIVAFQQKTKMPA